MTEIGSMERFCSLPAIEDNSSNFSYCQNLTDKKLDLVEF